MSVVPTFRSIVGEGKPRIIVQKPANVWASFGTTTYTATTVTEASGATVAVTASNVADYIDCGAAHGLAVGDKVLIAGHTGSVPDINGEHLIVRVDSATRVTLEVNITTGGTGGTVAKTPNFDRVRAGARVLSSITRAGMGELIVYGKATAVDRVNKIITVDEWIGGTPAGGTAYTVNGSVIDLPITQEMVQVFSPIQLVHPLWRSRLSSKFRGYAYSCRLNYATFISADTLYSMSDMLTLDELDTLVVVPHRDKPQYNYNVLYDGDFSLASFGIAGGHKGFGIVFRGTEPVQFPVSATGYGFNYGLLYGTGL